MGAILFVGCSYVTVVDFDHVTPCFVMVVLSDKQLYLDSTSSSLQYKLPSASISQTQEDSGYRNYNSKTLFNSVSAWDLHSIRGTYRVGLERSSTGRTKVAVVLSRSAMTRGNTWSLSRELTPHCRPLLDNPEKIPIGINVLKLQALRLMPRFVQGPPTLGLDAYGSMILDFPLFLSFVQVLIKAGKIPRE